MDLNRYTKKVYGDIFVVILYSNLVFTGSNLGQFHYLLGMQVWMLEDSIFISQLMYMNRVNKILSGPSQ